MKAVLRITIAFAGATVVYAPAAGQQIELADKRLVLADFANCLVRMGAGQSEKLLRTEPGSPEERHAAEVLGRGQSSCLTNRMFLSMQPGMIRGLVAEAMFKRHHPDWLVAAERLPSSAPVRPARPVRAAGSAERAGAKAGRQFMDAYSTCLAKAAPAQVAKLLGTGIDSPEEQQAILGFGDDLHDCMPFGVKYELNVGSLRANLASALYLQFAGQQQSAATK